MRRRPGRSGMRNTRRARSGGQRFGRVQAIEHRRPPSQQILVDGGERVPLQIVVIDQPLVDEQQIRDGDGLVIEARSALRLGEATEAAAESAERLWQRMRAQVVPRDADVLAVMESPDGSAVQLRSPASTLHRSCRPSLVCRTKKTGVAARGAITPAWVYLPSIARHRADRGDGGPQGLAGARPNLVSFRHEDSSILRRLRWPLPAPVPRFCWLT